MGLYLENQRSGVSSIPEVHALLERETGRKLKRLCCDNEGEFTLREFEEHCSSHGIRHEKTVPGTPITQWCS